MSDLPPGWEWARFADVARVAANLVDPVNFPDEPHVAPNHIESWTGKLLGLLTVAQDGVTSSKHRFGPGQILYSKIRPYLAKVVRIEFSGLCSADMYPIDSFIDSRYLKAWMLTPAFTASACKHQGRSVLPKINAGALASLPVPVPPLSEQRRIAAAIEGQFSRLEAAVGSLNAARRRREMLVRALREATFFPAAEDGETCVLGESLERIEAGRSFGGAARRAAEGEWGIVKVSAMTWGEFREAENKVLLDPTMADSRYEIRSGDILLSRANTKDYVGAAVLVAATRPNLLLSDKSLRLVPKSGFDPRWLVEVLSSPSVRRQISELATGNQDSMRNISQAGLRSVRIPRVHGDRQREQVAILADRLSAVRSLDTELSRAAQSAEGLRQGLLADAFAGRLVPQDPTDEPASVLLERIRAERAAAPKPKRARRGPRTDPAQETLS